ncbi:type II toxin-antitoxin system RelE/ParE family toxin [Capnocytophaga canimorsus]|uniref:type II toxin-antitoxin system RelE/ParE family toxin n=1 Tax=Capnocytophaga canimorsus TaxID=28188 RepID=UPI0037D0DCD5
MSRVAVWAHIANIELYNALDYWKKRNKSSAYSNKVFSSVQVNLKLLLENPYLGSPFGYDGVRKFLIMKRFSLYYYFDDDYLYIVHFWDNSRDLENF